MGPFCSGVKTISLPLLHPGKWAPVDLNEEPALTDRLPIKTDGVEIKFNHSTSGRSGYKESLPYKTGERQIFTVIGIV